MRSYFKKVIDHMPSGKFRWVVSDDLGSVLASGKADNYREARRCARTVVRRESKHYQTR